ncbi:hypothetical protein ANCCAN_05171 [Ancylostoma caninum]|uniref:Uncharacterized protein n=1 Tax=Ancylostoma caninum TaxID=29170 RepID=A0A368GZD2_ANCCA|nr:hypothetical protein ANCCAN_05171 [Ancylostoma caninum]
MRTRTDRIGEITEYIHHKYLFQMSKPASQSVTSDSPERAFSYADAAKKSSEPSRDNSPACMAVASPSAKSDSPAPQTPTPLACGPVDQCGAEVLPCADVAARGSGVADGLSFFYDESEAAQCEHDDQGKCQFPVLLCFCGSRYFYNAIFLSS